MLFCRNEWDIPSWCVTNIVPKTSYERVQTSFESRRWFLGTPELVKLLRETEWNEYKYYPYYYLSVDVINTTHLSNLFNDLIESRTVCPLSLSLILMIIQRIILNWVLTDFIFSFIVKGKDYLMSGNDKQVVLHSAKRIPHIDQDKNKTFEVTDYGTFVSR